MDNRHLIAAEGMVLTNGEIYVAELWLGDGDSVDNWHEITREEADALQEALLEDIPAI
jgi:hypothetical protein